MKRQLIFSSLVLLFISIACSEEVKKEKKGPTKEELKSAIKEMDDSLKVLYQKVMEEKGFQFPNLAATEAINRHLAYYRAFPEDSYSAECLDKVQQLFMQKKAYESSLKYIDTLLVKYPTYKNKAQVLLNAGSTGEIVQDTTIIRKYYTKLLNECPKLDAETKEMVTFRLEHLHLTFDQLIDLQIKEASRKK
jgi:tetratricopeptide (TPR) repeat protein